MTAAVDTVFADPRVQRAFRFLAENESRIESDQIRISMVPAPPFGESERARLFSDELGQLGLRPVTDAIGNVIASYQKFGPEPVVIGAHLDTVFPASTPLEMRRKGRIVYLPGISDNGSGIVALLWFMRAAREVGLGFRRPVIAVGNVGEEGEGNLRGIRHLFHAPPWEGRTCDFIAIDGGGTQRITHQALGSRRFRIRMTGPGGHSWSDFGMPNPVQGMATAVHLFSTRVVPRKAATSFNFGVLRGGISVNAIPSESLAEVDLRAVASKNLDEMEALLRTVVSEAAGAGGVDFKIESMGERPAGETSLQSNLVQTALEVTRRFGIEPHLDVGSTDANIPMSLGIPAISIGAGGSSGNVHTNEEWFDPLNRAVGLQRLLALVAALAG